MSKKRYLIIRDDNILHTGILAETEEKAIEKSKELAKAHPNKKFWIFKPEQYAICEINPATFYSPDFIREDEDNTMPLSGTATVGGALAGWALTNTGLGTPAEDVAEPIHNTRAGRYNLTVPF